LHNFAGYPNDGAYGRGGLLLDSKGNLYGTTVIGGAHDDGVVFKLNKAGKETILYSFAGSQNGDGAYPVAGLIQDAAGNFYGTTNQGGSSSCSCGVVFKLSKAAKETVLHSFTGGSDGGYLSERLYRDQKGILYGTTNSGGSGYGVVFKIDTHNKETVLYSFTGGADGAVSTSRLVPGKSGYLYGTTFQGGSSSCSNGCGTIFKIKP